LLHGYGSNADDLIDLAPELAGSLPDAVFVSPNAPFSFEMAPFGYQWFSLQSYSPQSLLDGARQATPCLERMIEEVGREFSLPLKRMALLGFSQGCMMSLHVAPRLSESLAAVAGFSGALVAPEKLPAETISRPPVLLVHGQMDPVVPYASLSVSAAALAACGFSVETVSRPLLQHGIDGVGLGAAADFLARYLPSPS
jgi:phospholipase/carboxylesterase